MNTSDAPRTASTRNGERHRRDDVARLRTSSVRFLPGRRPFHTFRSPNILSLFVQPTRFRRVSITPPVRSVGSSSPPPHQSRFRRLSPPRFPRPLTYFANAFLGRIRNFRLYPLLVTHTHTHTLTINYSTNLRDVFVFRNYLPGA